MDSKKIILVVLSFCFGGVFLYNLGIFSEKGISQSASGRKAQPLSGLKLDTLKAERSPYQGVKRDIFSPPISHVQKASVEKIQPASLQILPDPTPPSELQVFVSESKFMGFLENNANRTAFIMRGGDVYTVKKGDFIDRNFIVVDVLGESIIIKDNDTGEVAKIQLPLQK